MPIIILILASVVLGVAVFHLTRKRGSAPDDRYSSTSKE